MLCNQISVNCPDRYAHRGTACAEQGLRTSYIYTVFLKCCFEIKDYGCRAVRCSIFGSDRDIWYATQCSVNTF